MTPERRSFLASKGQTLYGKYCGTNGRGICAESFACYHLQRGETVVAADLLAYLEQRIAQLRATDPDQRLEMTVALAERIRNHLREFAAPTAEESS